MESLAIKGKDVVTAFLGCTEEQILNKRTIYKDFVEVQDRFDYPENRVRVYNLALPNQGFQLILDLDKNKIITQRTFYPELDVKRLFDNLTKDSTDTYQGRVLYNYRLSEDIYFNLEQIDSYLTIKSDIY